MISIKYNYTVILDLCIRMEQLFTFSIICLILFGYYFRPSQQNNSIVYNIPDPGSSGKVIFMKFDVFVLECTGVFNLCTDLDKERLAREAIKAIHEQMDDDKDGMIESSESTDVSLFDFSILYVKSLS